MFHIIHMATKVAFYLVGYATILVHLAQANGYVLRIFTDLFDNGVPDQVAAVLSCTVSTLNWIFTKKGVDLALLAFISWPAVKFSLYISHKFISA